MAFISMFDILLRSLASEMELSFVLTSSTSNDYIPIGIEVRPQGFSRQHKRRTHTGQLPRSLLLTYSLMELKNQAIHLIIDYFILVFTAYILFFLVFCFLNNDSYQYLTWTKVLFTDRYTDKIFSYI